jgi:hypothetical protein
VKISSANERHLKGQLQATARSQERERALQDRKHENVELSVVEAQDAAKQVVTNVEIGESQGQGQYDASLSEVHFLYFFVVHFIIN